MPKKPIYMETTEIAAERTAAEVSGALVQAGATSEEGVTVDRPAD